MLSNNDECNNKLGEDSEICCNVREAFAQAGNYERVRQDFPVEAVEYFLRKLGLTDNGSGDLTADVSDRPFTILEVGCGTGKFTRVMLEVLKGKNVKVIASEPVRTMYEEFRTVVPDTEIIQCPAEKIPLPDGSIDVVIAARSFHWFTNRAALQEFHRVLAANGSLGLIWSMENLSLPWLKDFAEFLKRTYKESSLVLPHVHRDQWISLFNSISENLFNVPEECVGFEYSMKSSIDHAFNLFASYSMIAGGSEQVKKDFPNVFDGIMKKHFKDKSILFDAIQFKIHIYWCTKKE